MEVVSNLQGGVKDPFHNHEEREWSRLDTLTGILERARLETDNWTANTANSCHKYGKVVDSRARTNADGAVQQQARRQLEVYQTHMPGGHLQVVKTQTVSSSRWRNQSSLHNFEDLQLALNPLDLSSQKSKASVGRSGGRRPPSRPRTVIRDDPNPLTTLHRVPRLCHQIKDNKLVKKIEENSHKLVNGHRFLSRTKSTSSEDLAIPEKEKSTKSTEDLEDLEQLQSWRRTSKIRHSLQYPKQHKSTKPNDLPENSGSVRKIREELEKGRRLNTALRGNNVDLEALDQILQSISSSSSIQSDNTIAEETKPTRNLLTNKDELKTKQIRNCFATKNDPYKQNSLIKTESTEESDILNEPTEIKDSTDEEYLKSNKKRNSFVTVESLQEVKGRLRRTSSPSKNIYKSDKKDEEIDDGIVEDNQKTDEMPSNNKNKVRSYVYGMEMMNKKPILGTGSLESRSKFLNGTLRNEDWYNRRKSYGFEQVHNSSPSLRKNRTESSTDSGICRSSEIVLPTKNNENIVKKLSSIFDNYQTKSDIKSTTITIPIKNCNENEVKRHSIAVDESKYVTNTPDNDKYRRTSLAEEDRNRKLKKVEFCKTEVHFAADSGKVNIVETDEKPPPTNNFRRRRRNSGPIMDFDLPILHFGDSSYEKTLLGMNDDDNPTFTCGTVTVNTAYKSQFDSLQEEYRRDNENDNIKGILKNKQMKPIPYHLGEVMNTSDDDRKWGIRLKSVKTETPIWKSTVTLKNTIYPQDNQPEFQKLLRNLRPINTKPDLVKDFSTKFLQSPSNRRSSMADRIKLGDDSQLVENRLYSTKVNFGEGETIVVENEAGENAVWGKRENKDSKQILNKGLVVRIGRDTVKTTTKITIDLSPSPSTLVPTLAKNHQRSHNFKSTSLILDTIKNDKSKIPEQLEALKKLYEDVNSDSDADKEVQVLMSRMEANEEDANDEKSSVVSGSWSKMRASRAINQHLVKHNRLAKIEKDYSSDDRSQPSPLLHKTITPTKRPTLKTAKINDKLSSPSLVGRTTTTETSDFRTVNDAKLQQKHTSDMVLRQPRKSEMAYFGVIPSPKQSPVIRKSKMYQKPDILHHIKEKSPDIPIYENIDSRPSRYGREFDSNILEELTKAADQILQAVNGFADDTDDEPVKEPLDTIAESKSWKQNKQTKTTTNKPVRTKLRNTPSTSSVESLKPVKTQEDTRLTKKKTITESSSRQNTKARRLQRASSREALLQSHGSSSEDLATPQRKPRQIKKTRVTQLTMSNGLELKKKSEKIAEPIAEIRHKMAVSTIKSTMDSGREKGKGKGMGKKIVPPKKIVAMPRNEVRKPSGSSTVNHRISTANIKKCHRSDTTARH